MSTTTLSLLLLAVAVLLHVTARAQATTLVDRARPRADEVAAPRGALVAELTRRLRVGAVGCGIGTLLGIALVVVSGGERSGPDALADVALVLTATVVCGVVAEALHVLRRGGTPPPGPRTASLHPRQAHAGPAARLAELGLVAVALAALAVALVGAADGIDGARGSVASAVGALVLMAVCAGTRARLVRRAMVAQDTDELALATAADAVSVDRFGENLLASGGVLVASALLVPALTAGPGGLRVTAVCLGLALVLVVVVQLVLRRAPSERVDA